MDKAVQRIALWNTAFLGDAVLCLPLLQSLRLRYPAARIDFYVRKGLEGLFVSHPALNAVYAYDKRGQDRGPAGFARMAKDIAGRRYDLWISAHTSPRSGMLALASRAPVRIGYSKPPYNRLFYNRVVERRFTELEEIERLLELLRPLGPGALSAWPEIALGRAEEKDAADFFAALNKPVLGMHPGSVWATKRWPEAYFAEIGLRSLRRGAQVLLFSGPGEEEIAREVARLMRSKLNAEEQTRLHDLSGCLPLPLFAAFLGRVSCYLTNDSGPMHLAWAQHTPVVAVFGPTTRALGFFPRGEIAKVFETELSCRPCGLHGPAACPLGHHRCMTNLTPEPVWEDVRAKLGLA